MHSGKARPTVDELFELLKRTNLPTVLVEGKDDIIFYRRIEEDLKEYGIDMLPAGNKDAVLDLYKKLKEVHISSPIIFVVDNDLWVHCTPFDYAEFADIITTDGYSIENDLYSDGDLENLLGSIERSKFFTELQKFAKWYALSVRRRLSGADSAFRTHPRKILEDDDFFQSEMKLDQYESYPDQFLEEIINNYKRILRGKSLFQLLLRQLSSTNRPVKFSAKQLMEIGASRRGKNFQKIRDSIKQSLEFSNTRRFAGQTNS